ncbi:hypothetical protein LDENG_00004270, partial [Lucifuga dentata]
MTVSGNHSELIVFHLMDSPQVPIVLGHPWLLCHNPQIDWKNNSIVRWGPACSTGCLVSAHSSLELTPSPPEEYPDLSLVPPEYMDLKRVFSKSRAVSLPPHRPYDCCIELLPGTSPPKGRLFSLALPEQEAMDKYINDSLAAGIICPSSSPAGVGFFFVEKKDKSLHPCIDY